MDLVYHCDAIASLMNVDIVVENVGNDYSLDNRIYDSGLRFRFYDLKISFDNIILTTNIRQSN